MIKNIRIRNISMTGSMLNQVGCGTLKLISFLEVDFLLRLATTTASAAAQPTPQLSQQQQHGLQQQQQHGLQQQQQGLQQQQHGLQQQQSQQPHQQPQPQALVT
ncbi:hypothetical protein LSTR_LSTR015538 [Laodelphax striatellus]|uniref:Uncharacterized protein n=1 Tax=Laodelphax striatellus TaxID=195883 RepID=A0A482WYU3_LAOST|nr:hypothetical protein LSTR_LSTR015538 [Laodelphax striatellus]